MDNGPTCERCEKDAEVEAPKQRRGELLLHWRPGRAAGLYAVLYLTTSWLVEVSKLLLIRFGLLGRVGKAVVGKALARRF